MKKIFKKYSLLALALVMLSSCKKEYLETGPTGDVPTAQIFQTTDGAYVSLNGTYRIMWATFGGSQGHFGQRSYDMTMDLMGNDMVIHTQGYNWFVSEYQYVATISPTNSRPGNAWAYYYTIINNANIIIKNIDAAVGPQADKDNIKGQALALRAYSYFYLINLWQKTYKGNETAPGVPLYTEPTTVGKGRGTVQEVYDQMTADLQAAETLLTGKTRKANSHINLATVKGIWARVALMKEDWATAATKAAEARQGIALMSNTTYAAGFSKFNSEWIWGLEIQNDQATGYGSFFSHADVSTQGYAYFGQQRKITKVLYDQMNPADTRRALFRTPGTGTSTYPDYTCIKFKAPTAGSWAGDYILMRAAEMYLIEAEAKARLGQEPGARTALEALVTPRLTGYSAAALSGTALINEILLQRRIELWGEGWSFLDLKRLNLPLDRPTGTGNYNPALASILTLPVGDPKWLWKIPQTEIDANDALGPDDQNQ